MDYLVVVTMLTVLAVLAVLAVLVVGYLGWIRDLRKAVRRQAEWLGSLDREFDVLTNLLTSMHHRTEMGHPPTPEEMAEAEAALIALLDQLLRTQHKMPSRLDLSL